MADFRPLKEVVINKTNKSYVYYLPLGPNSFKIEPKVLNLKYNEMNVVGWRVFINLNVRVSNVANSTFKIPIQKREGKIAEMYDLYFDERKFNEITTQDPNGKKQISHPLINEIISYVNHNYENKDYHISIDDIRDERRKGFDTDSIDKGLDDFSILHINDNFANELVMPFSEKQPYKNPEEEDLLSLDDISNISFNIPKITSEKKEIIKKLLRDMCLDFSEQEGTGLSTREMLEIYSCIQNYINGEQPNFSGIVLYGPPGTGKTHLIQKSLIKIYEELGFNTHQEEIGEMLSNQYVGGLATNVTKKIFGPAISKIKKNRKPCFIYIDEATDLLRKSSGSESDSGWRGQGIEAMKSFINRSRYPGIIVCLATNLEKENFDEALTRSGRLQKVYIGLPNYERCVQIWNYVNDSILFSKDDSNKFSESQISELSRICQDKINVATITETASSYKIALNRNWGGNFEEFKKDFGKKAISDLKEEEEKAIKNIEDMGKGRFMPEAETKEKVQEITREFAEKYHIIEIALDPNKQTTKQGLLRTFTSFFTGGEKKVENRYKIVKNSLNKWLQLLQSNPQKFLYSENSLRILNRTSKLMSFIINHLTDDQNEIKEKLIYLDKVFLELIKINENPNYFPKIEFNTTTLRNLITTIESLPKELTKNEEIPTQDNLNVTENISNQNSNPKLESPLVKIKEIIEELDSIHPQELNIEIKSENLIEELIKLISQINEKLKKETETDVIKELKIRIENSMSMLNASLKNNSFQASQYNFISNSIHFILEHMKEN